MSEDTKNNLGPITECVAFFQNVRTKLSTINAVLAIFGIVVLYLLLYTGFTTFWFYYGPLHGNFAVATTKSHQVFLHWILIPLVWTHIHITSFIGIFNCRWHGSSEELSLYELITGFISIGSVFGGVATTIFMVVTKLTNELALEVYPSIPLTVYLGITGVIILMMIKIRLTPQNTQY